MILLVHFPFLDPFIHEADADDRTKVINTEELCQEIEASNERILRTGVKGGPFQRDGKLIIGSIDAEKIYPNLDTEQTAEEAKKKIIDS